ncbi:stage III sporulation protein AG [Clostridium sp.]|uniref:stage III sporulation protein AG n=1 Tax=Clostridium sp. TaxID=1506 RepID=UPI002A910C5D|nr:stage III sporulation protein AG [Clostridium sp.]MDY6011796.1 stage III sporulation protein AG [Clostridium sp.]
MDKKKLRKSIDNFFKSKNVSKLVAIVIAVIVLLLGLSVVKPSDNKEEVYTSGLVENKDSEDSTYKSKETNQYELEQKEELISILKKMDGVGSVDVMISFESGEKKVPAYDQDTQTSVTEETDSEGGKRVNEQKNDGSKVVMTTDNKGNEPFIIQTYKPKVISVFVVAEGAENSKTKYEIQKVVSNLYNLSIDKVNVYSMKN